MLYVLCDDEHFAHVITYFRIIIINYCDFGGGGDVGEGSRHVIFCRWRRWNEVFQFFWSQKVVQNLRNNHKRKCDISICNKCACGCGVTKSVYWFDFFSSSFCLRRMLLQYVYTHFLRTTITNARVCPVDLVDGKHNTTVFHCQSQYDWYDNIAMTHDIAMFIR